MTPLSGIWVVPLDRQLGGSIRPAIDTSKGRLRYANRIITQSLQLATEKNMNHLPDEIIQQAINLLQV